MTAERKAARIFDPQRGLLQWSRGRMTAERPCEDPHKPEESGLQWSRGRMTAESRSSFRSAARATRFNGAAVG
mgnify:CR=1 FL=1